MHYLDSLEEYQQLLRHLSEGLSPVSVTGITESARADFISALLRDQKKNGFVIVESMLDARVLKEEDVYKRQLSW